MANVLFIGDIHGGHKNIIKYRDQFRDEQDHFDYIEQSYHKKVTKRDKVIFTGDVAFSEEYWRRINQWVGNKVLIPGNHCTERVSMANILRLCNFESVHAMLKYKEFWVTHAPLHPVELRGKYNIHGHVHNQTLRDARYINTSVENIGYAPISLHEIREIIERRKIAIERFGDYDARLDAKEMKR